MNPNEFTATLAKFICIFAIVAWAPSAKAVDYAVTVSRDASNYYLQMERESFSLCSMR